MSRIRTIKPEFWTSEQVVECSPTARLLFIGFWNFADDNGVLPASAKHIKMLVYPGDDFTVAQVQGFIDELLHQGLLAGFTAEDGRAYWYVTGWSRHQKIDKPSNKYPAPPPVQDSREKIQQPVVEYSTNPRRTFDESSVTERSVEEGKGKEGKGRGVEEEARTPTHPTQPVLPVAEATPVKASVQAERRSGKDEALPDCPDWLNAAIWQQFVEHRKAKRKPLSARGAQITLSNLARARDCGHDPAMLIETAIANGWTGCVFADRHYQRPNGKTRPATERKAKVSIPLDPEAAKFNAILLNMNRTVIEGEASHELH